MTWYKIIAEISENDVRNALTAAVNFLAAKFYSIVRLMYWKVLKLC